MEEALALLSLTPQTLYKQSTKVFKSSLLECGMWNGDMAATRRHEWRHGGDKATRSGEEAGIRA